MKKLLSLALVLVLAFSLVACKKAEEKPAEPAAEGTEAPATEGTESVPAEQADSVQTGEKATMTGDEVVALQADAEQEGKYVIVDVRSADEYAAGHIKDAKNIPLDDIKNDPSVLDAEKDKKIVLYCNSGKKSGQAQDALLAAGFTDVVNADGVKTYQYDLVTE